MIKKFKKPIYVCQPIFPDINKYTGRLKKIWNSGFITNGGPQTRKLEDKLAKYLDIPHISLFNNGTAALYAAIRFLKLKGEVITTPFTFASTPHTLTLNNITPVFCDIDDKTYNINPGNIEKLITSKTTGILAVHIFGVPCDVKGIKKIADKHKLKVIYDAAHAFGSKVYDVGIGNFGDVSIFSFHATKFFHTAEGGGVVCKNRETKIYFDRIRNFGIKNSDEIVEPGLNGKMSELHAALGLEVLNLLKKHTNRRNEIFGIYRKKLKNIDGIDFYRGQDNLIPQYFIIRVNKKKFGASRDDVHEQFKNYNVYTRKYFYPLCSSYPHYKNLLSSDMDNLIIANKVADEVLALPFHSRLSEADAMAICELLISFAR